METDGLSSIVSERNAWIEPGWEQAHSLAATCPAPMGTERIALAEAAGRVLAEPLSANAALPSFDSSAMDGWAVAGPPPWRLVGEALAGQTSDQPIEPGTCVTIATGALVPAGADGVLRSEHGVLVERQHGIDVERSPDARPDEPGPREHVRPAGAEANVGDVLLDAGTALRPRHLGLAAAAGFDTVPVRRRPRVAILILGDELVHEGTAPAGRVRDVFAPMLPAIVRALGAEVETVRHVPDTLAATAEALSGCGGDLVWTTGGTASGPVDHIHAALHRVGGTIVVDSVAMRPGHPLLFGTLADGRAITCLPGNPLSAIVGIVTACWPMINASMGLAGPPRERVVAAQDLPGLAKFTQIVPVVRDGSGVTSTRWRGSGMLRGVAQAHALAIVPAGGVDAGDVVDVIDLPL